MAKSLNSTKLDEEKIINAIKKHNPTVISLSFCYTDKNELNDILRSAGIYSKLILSKDQANITEDRYILQDPLQKGVIDKIIADDLKIAFDQYQNELIEKFVNDNPQNVLLAGHYGCGKTTIGCFMCLLENN